MQVKAKMTPNLLVNQEAFKLRLMNHPFWGNDEAANPVGYTLDSLAGCLNVVAHLTVKEFEIGIKSLKIHVEGDLNPGRLVKQGFGRKGRFY